MNLRKTLLSVATLAGLIAAGPVLAHSDEYLDTQPAPHGGQLRMAGSYHFELVVAKDSKQAQVNPVRVYVTDHAGAKVPTAGAKGSVTLLAGKTRSTISLTPGGDNLLQGSGTYASVADLKAVVSVTIAGQSPEQARFTPLMPATPRPAGATPGHSGHAH